MIPARLAIPRLAIPRLAILAAMLAFSTHAWAQDCSGPDAPSLRQTLISCPRGQPFTVGPGQPVPRDCRIILTTPVCQAGFDNPVFTDITGQWAGSPVNLALDTDGQTTSGQLQGRATSPLGDVVFDPPSRTLTFHYQVPSRNVTGQAALLLAPDDSRLAGAWQWSSGETGFWTFTRPGGQALTQFPGPPTAQLAPPQQTQYADQPQPPQPVCHQGGWSNLSPLSGASLTVQQSSAGGAVCVISVTTPSADRYLKIFTRPAHGDLEQPGPLMLRYHPAPGYQGPDSYSFGYCGRDNNGSSGCATLTYNVDVTP